MANETRRSPLQIVLLTYGIVIAVLTSLNALFWLTSDFRKFTPSSEGPLLERLILILASELGPLSLVIWPIGGIGGALVLTAICVVGIVAGIRWPRSAAAFTLGVMAVLLWFFCGCLRTSLRIT